MAANSNFVAEKIAEAEKLMLAAQKEFFAAIEFLEETEDDTTGVRALFNSTGTLIRSTTREKILVKHNNTAPKTAAISRGIN